MRKKAPKRASFEEGISKLEVLELLSTLRRRVEQLEGEVFPCGLPLDASQVATPRKGRKPRLETEEILKRRASLSSWLEQNWPRLSVPLRRAESSGNHSEAIAAFVAVKKHGVPGVFQPPFYDAPEAYEKELGEFLEKGRFRGNPRNLAAAMAGLPQLSWKRSFDICIAHPHKTGHMLEVYWDHMRRN